MKPETEILVVAALDGMLTKIDMALDELDDGVGTNISNAEHILMKLTMEINGLIDRLTEEAHEEKQ